MSFDPPPLLSIVVPTRERADTLLHTLETLRALGDIDHEIVVCDNASTDLTAQVIASRNNPRIRHVRAPQRLSMPENFSLGLDSARGHYVMTLGDDDLVLPVNLERALAAVTSRQCDLVYWHRAFFYWGSYPHPGMAGYFGIPRGHGLHAVDLAAVLASVMRWRVSYQYLPSIYNSLIHRSFLERYRRFLGGRWFPDYTVAVDAMSALVFASLAPRACFQQSPSSISGISHNSNGMSNLTDRRESDRFARELGFDDPVQQMMPESYRGAVAVMTPRGHGWLSTLGDYSSALRRILCHRHHHLEDCDALERSWLRSLVAQGDMAVRPDSALAQAMQQDPGAAPVEDALTWFFDFWNIPRPELHSAKFEGNEATVLHLLEHLQRTGFNRNGLA